MKSCFDSEVRMIRQTRAGRKRARPWLNEMEAGSPFHVKPAFRRLHVKPSLGENIGAVGVGRPRRLARNDFGTQPGRRERFASQSG